jgi:hypothetical protein
MSYAVEMIQRFVNGDPKVDEPMLNQAIDAIDDWKKDRDPKKADPVEQLVLDNLLTQLAAAKERAPVTTVLLKLPGGAEKLKPPAPPTPTPTHTPKPWIYQGDKYWNVGLSFRQDTGALWVLDKIGIPVSSFISDQQYYNFKPSIEFPMGDLVGMARFNIGAFALKGVPGDATTNPNEKMNPARGYHRGIDLGLVDPTSKSHLNAGLGLEFTGIDSYSGTGNKPSSLPRLHFYRETEHTFGFGDFQLGISSFYNNQETYLPLGKGDQLLTTGGTPFSTSSSLYARSSIPLLVVSGRYYLNGRPDYPNFDPSGNVPFQAGEGATKVASLIPSKFVMFNRARDVAAFANNQVFMALEPFGAKTSRDQFDQLSIGLFAYSVLDGLLMASNADTQAEILRRGDGWHQGAMFAIDGVGFLAHVIGAANAKADPPANQTLQQFQQNPGSVIDFDGRANEMLWKTDLWEGALTAATYGLEEATNKKGFALTDGDEGDKKIKDHNDEIRSDRSTYQVVGGVAAGVGLLGVLTSGLLTGQGCGSEGSFLACTFPGTREKFFAPGQNFTPATMTGIENHYVVSSIFASLIPWGTTKFLYPFLSSTKDYKESQNSPNHGYVTGRLEFTPSKVFATVSGTF